MASDFPSHRWSDTDQTIRSRADRLSESLRCDAPERERALESGSHTRPTIGTGDPAVPVGASPAKTSAAATPDAADRAECALAHRVESFGIHVERLVQALAPADAPTLLASEPLRGVLVNLPDVPDVPVSVWLHALLYLGRAVAPPCRQALLAGDLLRAQALATELLQALPTIMGCASASMSFVRSLGAPADPSAATAQPAPLLRQALATDAVAQCLARLRDDLTVLDRWVKRNAAVGSWPEPLATWPSALATPIGGATLPPDDAAAQMHATQMLLCSIYMPGLPVLPPVPSSAIAQLSLSAPEAPVARAPAAPWPPSAYSRMTNEPRRRRPAPCDVTGYRGDRRALGVVSGIALMLLLLAMAAQVGGVPPVWGGAWAANAGADEKSQAAGSGHSPNTNPAPAPSGSPASATPTSSPTPTASSTVGTHSIGIAVPVVPLARALTLSCGGHGTALLLHNPGSTPQTWRLGMPPGLLADGTHGVVNPGKTLIIHLWRTAGQRRGTARLYVQSAGKWTAVNLVLLACRAAA
jgi:hypothetical protein